jgi:hypothetical protein
LRGHSRLLEFLVGSVGALSLIGFLPLVFYASILGLDEFHDGLIFKSAFDIAAGALYPGQEYSQYGFLFDSGNALVLWLSGFKFVSLKFLTSSLYFISFSMLVVLVRKVSNAYFSFLAALLFLLLYPFMTAPLLVWPSVLSMTLTLIFSYLLISSILDDSRLKATSAGVLCASLLFVKVTVGAVPILALLAGFAFSLVLNRSFGLAIDDRFVKHMRLFFASCAIATLLFFSYLAAVSSFGYWLEQNILLPIRMSTYIPEVWYNRDSGIVFILQCLFPLNLAPVWLLIPIAVVAISIFTIAQALRAPVLSRDTCLSILLCAIAGGSWAQYYPVADTTHMFWSAIPMLPAIAFAMERALRPVSRIVLGNRFQQGAADFLMRPAVRLVAACLMLGAAAIWYLNTWSALNARQAGLIPVNIPKLALLRDTRDNVANYEAVFDAARTYERTNGASSLVNITTDALYSVFVSDPKNWHRSPIVYALYQSRPQSLEFGNALDRAAEKDVRQLVYAKGYEFLVPSLRAIAKTTQGGVLLREGPPEPPGVLPALDRMGLSCAVSNIHAALSSNFYFDDPRRFWGYHMPPVRAQAGVVFDILLMRRRVEGINSVVIDADTDPASPSGFKLRRFQNKGESYFLAERVGDRETPLLGFALEPEVVNHIQLWFHHGMWVGFLNGEKVGETKSALPSLASAGMVKLGAGRRFIDSLVGVVFEWRVIDLERCGDLAISAPGRDIAADANTSARYGPLTHPR